MQIAFKRESLERELCHESLRLQNFQASREAKQKRCRKENKAEG